MEFVKKKIINDVLNSRFLQNKTKSNIFNENIQVHFQTRLLIKQY